jgi:hypothetical protein
MLATRAGATKNMPRIDEKAARLAVRRSRRAILLRTFLVASILAAPALADAQVAISKRTVTSALDGFLDRLAASSKKGLVLYAPSEPERLRPCCAFGGEMKVELLGIPVPGYRHKPVRGPDEIGPHEYDPGLLQVLPSPISSEQDSRNPSRVDESDPKREHNGIVYTCRGGFLDTAHVRDFADLTWFLAARVESRLETGGVIDLVDYGGTRRISIRPVPRDKLRRAGSSRLAIAVAAQLSFDLSVWREIATWYGYESVPPWPEKLSSFSPEDLYSNLLGTRLAEAILRTTEIQTHREWDAAMTSALTLTMDALGVVPAQAARAYMVSVDGVLWDSTRPIPDWRVTKRRKFDRGPLVTPWTVHTKAGRREPSTSPCRAGDKPLSLRIPDRMNGIAIDDVAEIDVVVSDRLLRHGLPLPRPGDRHVVEADYPRLIEAVRRESSTGPADPAPRERVARSR